MKPKKRSIVSYWRDYLFIAPFFIVFFAFTILPVVIAIGISFSHYNILELPQFAGLANYIKMFFNDDIFTQAVMNTLVLAFATGPVGYLLALLLAWMINELSPKLRTLFVFCIYAPSITGSMYMIWQILFSDDSHGLINGMLINLNIIDSPIYWLTDTRYMMTIVIIVQLWMSMGTGFLSFVAGLQGVDRSLLEAGSLDGIKNRWQELWYVVLPSIRPQLTFGAVMSITAAFSIADITINLCGNPSTDYAVHTVVNHLVDYGSTRFDMGYASAIATVLFIAMVVSNKAFQRMISKIGG